MESQERIQYFKALVEKDLANISIAKFLLHMNERQLIVAFGLKDEMYSNIFVNKYRILVTLVGQIYIYNNAESESLFTNYPHAYIAAILIHLQGHQNQPEFIRCMRKNIEYSVERILCSQLSDKEARELMRKLYNL